MEDHATFDSRMDSFKASRIVSTPCSSTKSRRLRGSSFSGLNADSTIVDLNVSIVDSSLAFAASRVRITLCKDSISLVILFASVTALYLKVPLSFFVDILDSGPDLP